MAPMLFHGLNQLGLPVVCVESRQAYQALNSLAMHKTDRNDASGLAHLARPGFLTSHGGGMPSRASSACLMNPRHASDDLTIRLMSASIATMAANRPHNRTA